MKEVKVLGPGCARCKTTEEMVKVEAAKLGIDVSVEKITDYEAIAKFGLKDTKKTSGEEFYFAARLHLGPELFAAASALKAGQTSLPVKSGDGYHVLVASQNTPPVKMSFQEAREQVLTDYKNEAEAKLQANEEKFLIGRADILVADRYKKYLP